MTAAFARSAAATSMVDWVYQQVRQRILDNAWPPGHQALEQEIADQLGVSRTPVREALIRLHNEGLVEVVPRHGVRVLPVSPTDMREIYEVLTALEGAAVESLAARRPGAAELAPLVQATQDMAAALERGDLDGWASADERFHAQLVELAGNQTLARTVARFTDRAHRARMFSLKLRPKPVNSTREHMRLVELLQAGDVASALALNRAHRARAAGELLQIFETYRLTQL